MYIWKSYQFDKNVDLFIQNITSIKNYSKCIYNPYSLNSFLFVNNFDALVLSYQNSKTSQEMTVAILEEYLKVSCQLVQNIIKLTLVYY